MNLSKLFETQKLLDKRIVDEHNLHGQDLLPQKILALQVELGELAQEWRGFKFWSRDQEPRTFEWIGKCEKCNGHGVDDENISCPNCAGTGDGNKNPLLEEYVDVLHFILSIGNDVGTEYFYYEPMIKQEENITTQFITVFNYTYLILQDEFCSELFTSFHSLGMMLGFSWEQIEQSYYAKNKINHQRQTDKY